MTCTVDYCETAIVAVPPYRYLHGDVIKWKHFPHYWPFVRGIHPFAHYDVIVMFIMVQGLYIELWWWALNIRAEEFTNWNESLRHGSSFPYIYVCE